MHNRRSQPLDALPDAGYLRRGSKGDRLYDCDWLTITAPDGEAGGHHWLLVRRRNGDAELTSFRH